MPDFAYSCSTTQWQWEITCFFFSLPSTPASLKFSQKILKAVMMANSEFELDTVVVARNYSPWNRKLLEHLCFDHIFSFRDRLGLLHAYKYWYPKCASGTQVVQPWITEIRYRYLKSSLGHIAGFVFKNRKLCMKWQGAQIIIPWWSMIGAF